MVYCCVLLLFSACFIELAWFIVVVLLLSACVEELVWLIFVVLTALVTLGFLIHGFWENMILGYETGQNGSKSTFETCSWQISARSTRIRSPRPQKTKKSAKKTLGPGFLENHVLKNQL